MDWYVDEDSWSVHLAAGGPDEWQRIAEGDEPEVRVEPQVSVSNIETTNDSIRFEVNEPGTAVLVKASYFPNWTVSGADGPWRVSPNLMVVVPTGTEVELSYTRTGVEWLGWGLTLLGLLGLVWLVRAPALVMPSPVRPPRRQRAAPAGEPVEPGEPVESVETVSEGPTDRSS
jgi:hypothetical protein